MAKRRTLFDDRPIEISELTYIIRQDIASLNNQIAALQSYVRAQKANGSSSGGGGGGASGKGKGKDAARGQQVEEHNSNVVMLLQSRLASMGMGFKDVLELRTQVGLLVFKGWFCLIWGTIWFGVLKGEALGCGVNRVEVRDESG